MRRSAFRLLTAIAYVFSLVVPASAQLTTQTIVGDVSALVGFVQDPALPNTFYLVQRTGKVLVLENGTILKTPLLDLTGEVRLEGEEGLLGLAFSPVVASGWFFVNFTNRNGHCVIARFVRQANSPVAIPGSRLDLLWPTGQRFIEHPTDRHKGGQLAFGGDGFLYIGLGDGGGANDAFNNAQNPNSLLGKMLRIDVNVDPSDSNGYRVPASNPFVGLPTFGEIWAFGLRNPWKYTFDNPALGGTGALILADVGQSAREEVNYEPAGRGGRNYGWPIREGSIGNPGITEPPTFLPLTSPLFDYSRDIGHAVIGGYVYRGSALPASFRGRYFVADFTSGRVASVGLSVNPLTGEATVADGTDRTAEIGGDLLVSFAEDLSGELYLIRFSGPVAVAKIVVDPAAGLPTAPQSLTGQVTGSSVQLSWAPPSSGAPAEYQLEVGSTPGASDVLNARISGALTSLAASNVASGQYFARLRGVNTVGVGPASAEVALLVGCSGAPPAPVLQSHLVIGNIVAIAWDAVAGASGYLLEAGTAPGLADLAVVALPATPPGLVTAAPPGTYHVRVRALNACGRSAPSSQIAVVVP